MIDLPQFVEKNQETILLARQQFYEQRADNDPPVYIYFYATNVFPFCNMRFRPIMLELSTTLYGMVPVIDDRLTPGQFIITKEPLHG